MKIITILLLAPFLLFGTCNSSNEQIEKKEKGITKSTRQQPADREATPNCRCSETTLFAINCDTTFLSNQNFVYWITSCDSSKLIFQTLDGKKSVIEAFGPEEFKFSGRIGKSFIKEFKSGLLFEHRWISGCCMAPDYIIIDKKTGVRIKHFPTSLNLYYNSDFDFLITFRDSTLQELDIYNLENGRSKIIRRFSRKQAIQLYECNQQTANLFGCVKRAADSYTLPLNYTNEKGNMIKDSIIFTR